MKCEIYKDTNVFKNRASWWLASPLNSVSGYYSIESASDEDSFINPYNQSKLLDWSTIFTASLQN